MTKAGNSSDDEMVGSELSLLEHLNELRIRVTWAAGSLIVTTILSFVFAEQLLTLMLNPYARAIAEGAELQLLGPTEGIETFFKVSLMSGVILSMPLILYQLWLFISPGLTKNERKYVYIFVPSAFILFLTGLAFSWFVLVPAAISFLANATFLPESFRTDWQSREYMSFIIQMLLWVSISFEIPIIVYFIARVGIVTSAVLREQWRVAIVGIAVLAAAITPSIDPVTMLLTMAPLTVLYFLSIFLAWVGQRQFERSMTVDGPDDV
ncbi:MAG: twin-arginine translocase subunit TatC [Anaerolineales bacterium]|nr:twin-arginine translocase subunit TatC [Anaerolineales bacterium]